MGRLGLALGYIITGDERLLNEYNLSFHHQQRPIQPPPSKEWLRIVQQLNASAPVRSTPTKDNKESEA